MAKDEADRASEEEDYARAEALYKAQEPARLRPVGTCYNCDQPASWAGALFCDVECRRDYERRTTTLRKQHE